MTTDASFLKVISFDGLSMTGTYDGVFLTEFDIESQYESEPLMSESPDRFPSYVRSDPSDRIIPLHITIQDSTQARVDLLKRMFSPARAPALLRASDSNGVVRRMRVKSLGLTPWEGHGDRAYVAQLEAPEPIWEADALSTATRSMTGTASAIPVTVGGNEPTFPVLTLDPTALKSTNDPAFAYWPVVIAWRSPLDGVDSIGLPYPIDITNGSWDSSLGALGSDDVKVFVDGVEVDRYIVDYGSADTSVWCGIAFQPARIAILASWAWGVGATVDYIEVDDTSAFPEVGVLLINSECFTYNGKTFDRFLNVKRIRRGTTAASHLAGDSVYWVEHDIVIMQGWTGTAVGLADPDREPMLDMVNSSNDHHLYSAPVGEVTVVATQGANTSAVSPATVSTLSISNMVIPPGPDRALFVRVSVLSAAGAAAFVSGITFNGSGSPLALTFVGRATAVTGAGAEIWRLLNPAVSTTGSVSITLASGEQGIMAYAQVLTNVDQATPTSGFASAIGVSDAPTVNVVSTTADLVLDIVTTTDNPAVGTLNPGAGQVKNVSQQITAATPDQMNTGISGEVGAASVTMSWTATLTPNWAIAAVSVKRAAQPARSLNTGFSSPDTLRPGQWNRELKSTGRTAPITRMSEANGTLVIEDALPIAGYPNFDSVTLYTPCYVSSLGSGVAFDSNVDHMMALDLYAVDSEGYETLLHGRDCLGFLSGRGIDDGVTRREYLVGESSFNSTVVVPDANLSRLVLHGHSGALAGSWDTAPANSTTGATASGTASAEVITLDEVEEPRTATFMIFPYFSGYAAYDGGINVHSYLILEGGTTPDGEAINTVTIPHAALPAVDNTFALPIPKITVEYGASDRQVERLRWQGPIAVRWAHSGATTGSFPIACTEVPFYLKGDAWGFVSPTWTKKSRVTDYYVMLSDGLDAPQSEVPLESGLSVQIENVDVYFDPAYTPRVVIGTLDSGYLIDAQLENETTGQRLTFYGPLTLSSIVKVDTDAHVVTLSAQNGDDEVDAQWIMEPAGLTTAGAVVRDYIEWMRLDPAAVNSLRFTDPANGVGKVTLTVYWRNRWT